MSDTEIDIDRINEMIDEFEIKDNDTTSISKDDLSLDEEQEEDVKLEDLPYYACKYCGFHEPKAVAMCKQCGKWFCNIRGSSCGSHIIQHMVISKHKEIVLHPESALGEYTLECYNCSSRNIFQLGSIPTDDGSAVALICRENCLNSKIISDYGWDPSQWVPIISERSIVDWLVASPPPEENEHRIRKVTIDEIRSLEDLWKKAPAASIEDLTKKDDEENIQCVTAEYVDCMAYMNTFMPLITLEETADKAIKQEQSCDGVIVIWEKALNTAQLARFNINLAEVSSRVVIGDELKLSHRSNGFTTWEGVGFVTKIIDNEITLQLRTQNSYPTNFTAGFRVEFLWNGTTFKRMRNAITLLVRDFDSLSNYLYERLLGHQTNLPSKRSSVTIPTVMSAPNLPELNHSQISAARAALESNLCLIQGPPGTGKTVTSATIVYQLVQNNPTGHILVCAPSNIAVDHLAAKIFKTGVRVIRIAAKARETISSTVHSLCLHMLAPQLYGKEHPLYKLYQLYNTEGELMKNDERLYRKYLKSAEEFLLNNAQVICTTCAGAGDSRLSNMEFNTVLIDEATQATEPECLIPIVHKCQQLIIVGDDQQLGPVIVSKDAKKAKFDQSLFERLQITGIKPVRLLVQYRMHPALSEFSSSTFYDGLLQNGVTVLDRTRHNDFDWPRADKPMMFWCMNGTEEVSGSGTSYLNRSEAISIEKLLHQFLTRGTPGANIGIITPYEGQRAFLYNYLQKYGSLAPEKYADVEIASVDSFQGREKDYILLSCVRSNEKTGIGFLVDARRLNVALTRAKYGIVIVGNPRVLAKEPIWNGLLTYFQDKKCLVEGPLDNLKYYTSKIPKCRKYVNKQKMYLALQKQQMDTNFNPIPMFNSIGQDYILPFPLPLSTGIQNNTINQTNSISPSLPSIDSINSNNNNNLVNNNNNLVNNNLVNNNNSNNNSFTNYSIPSTLPLTEGLDSTLQGLGLEDTGV
ncbi:hypothetical protein WA158_006482 [Blastocystis sp. Blastoise]